MYLFFLRPWTNSQDPARRLAAVLLLLLRWREGLVHPGRVQVLLLLLLLVPLEGVEHDALLSGPDLVGVGELGRVVVELVGEVVLLLLLLLPAVAAVLLSIGAVQLLGAHWNG